MAATLSTQDAILKDVYLPGIRDQLNNKTVILKRLKRDKESFEGRRAFLALRTGRNEGVGMRGDNQTLPTAKNQQYVNATFGIHTFYGRIQITGRTWRGTKSDKGSFVRAVDSEVKGLTRDAKNDVNRQLFSDGSGALDKLITGGTAVTTFSVSGYLWDAGKYMKPGMTIDLRTSGSLGTMDTTEIVSYADSGDGTGIVTVSPAVTVATTATSIYAFRARESTTSEDVYGLSNLHTINPPTSLGAVSPFGSIDRTAAGNDYWHAGYLENGGTNRAVSTLLMQEAIDEAEVRGEGEISAIYTNHAIHRQYGKIMVSDKRYPGASGDGAMKLDGGYTALSFNGSIPVIRDKDAPNNKMFFVDEDSLVMFEQCDWEWMDKDGSMWARVSNLDAYEATLYKDFQLGCDGCNRNTVLADLAHS